MRARRRVMVAAVAVALVAAGAAGAARMGVLTIGVGGGSHAAATGIQVHGRWNLVVRAKDGKIVAHRRFENSLTSQGATALVGLITGALLASGSSPQESFASTVGGVGVRVDGTSTSIDAEGCQPPPVDADSQPNQCWLFADPCSATSDSACQSGLSFDASTSTTLAMTGRLTLNTATAIGKVETVLKECYPGESAGECADDFNEADAWWGDLTSKTLSPPLSVSAGQTVGVTVKISFS